jgi:urea-proton symporter
LLPTIVFPSKFYTAWLIIGIIWLWCTLLIATLYPIFDGRRKITTFVRALLAGATKNSEAGSQSGAVTPVSPQSVDNLEKKVSSVDV